MPLCKSVCVLVCVYKKEEEIFLCLLLDNLETTNVDY